MFPKTISKEVKIDDKGTKPTGIKIEVPTTTTPPPSKFKVCTIAAFLILVVLVVGVFGSIILYGKYVKQKDETVYRTFEDDGVKHSIEIITNDVDRVETVVFEKIENVTDGGTLMYDFNKKMIVAYSDKDDACYLWVNESLDWENRDWLFSEEPPVYIMKKNDEIPGMLLRHVVPDDIADKCVGLKTYWTTEATEPVRTERPSSTERNLRQKRFACRWYCRFCWRVYHCYYYYDCYYSPYPFAEPV